MCEDHRIRFEHRLHQAVAFLAVEAEHQPFSSMKSWDPEVSSRDQEPLRERANTFQRKFPHHADELGIPVIAS